MIPSFKIVGLAKEVEADASELTNPDARESPPERLGTRIANRFRGGLLEAPFDELRGATVQSLEAS